MRIAFFGSYKSFDYYQIGGMDSFTRRLGAELIRQEKEVSFVHFNCLENKSERTSEGISIFYFVLLFDALQYMAKKFDHIITIYVPPNQRPMWMRFRNNENNRIYFHKLYAGWSENRFKRTMGFAEAMIIPYNGTLFCVSPRLKQYVSKWSRRTELLLPPIPESYFLTTEEKPTSDHLRIAFVGRIDPGKGILVAINFFRYLAEEASDIQTLICGYPWKNTPETIRLHQELLNQDVIIYEHTDFESYSRTEEEKVRKVLRDTDILFLPYERLSSTVDTPLLLCEGMAHLCAVVTRPLGDLTKIYGTDKWMLKDLSNPVACLQLIRRLSERISEERKRLFIQCGKLKFRVNEVAYKFNALLGAHLGIL